MASKDPSLACTVMLNGAKRSRSFIMEHCVYFVIKVKRRLQQLQLEAPTRWSISGATPIVVNGFLLQQAFPLDCILSAPFILAPIRNTGFGCPCAPFIVLYLTNILNRFSWQYGYQYFSLIVLYTFCTL